MRIFALLFFSLTLSIWSIDAWAGLPVGGVITNHENGIPNGGAGDVFDGICDGSNVCDPLDGGGGNAGLGSVMVASTDSNLTFSSSQIARLGGAGLEGIPINLWVNGGDKNVDYDHLGASHDGHRSLVMVGADAAFFNALVLGVAASVEDAELDTSFNWGTTKQFGWGVNPYGVYTINKLVKLGLTGGYSFFTNSYENRASVNSGIVGGGADSERWHVAPNVILNHTVSKVRLFGQLSYLYSSESVDTYTNTMGNVVNGDDYYLGQIRMRARASYLLDAIGSSGFRIEPFIGGGYRHAFVKSITNVVGGPTAYRPTVDDDEYVAETGAVFRFSSSVLGKLLLNTVQGDDLEEYSVSGGFNFNF